ncbi:protein FAM107B isoform X3 [Pleurodeles waltl]
MAEPDYIDSDNPDLIRPKKMVNPVKISRNHQDLHRELLMNQKMGIAPQNKPELQKVMEKRKRDQVVKQHKEEDAQKKKSDFEIELQKRHQKLEQPLCRNRNSTNANFCIKTFPSLQLRCILLISPSGMALISEDG